MSRYDMEQIAQRLGSSGLVATLVVDSVESAVPLADALFAGGMDVMELTLRTPAAIGALAEVRKNRPEMLAGVGTVLTVEQVKQVNDAGGDFAVAPGLNENVVAAANKLGLPFAPGILTPSDVEKGISLGCKLMKFFPAEPSGGINYLKSMTAPYTHLGIKYIPLGGITEDNMQSYLSSKLILAIGGSWIAPREMINSGDWAGITRLVKQAVDKIKSARGE